MNVYVEFRHFATYEPIPGWRRVQMDLVPDKDEIIKLDDKAYVVARRQHKLVSVVGTYHSHTVLVFVSPWNHWTE